MNKELLKFLTLSIFLIAIGCSEEKSSDEKEEFIKDVSVDESGRPAFGYDRLDQKIEFLKLENLQDGFDSLAIRIWYEPQLLMENELIEIKNQNGNWSGLHIVIGSKRIEGTDSLKLEELRDKITPKSGWLNLIKQLDSKNIMSLPNMRAIENLEDNWTDGVCYNVEISTKSKYRYYSYHLPEYFQDNFSEARNMVDILKIVEVEFDIPNKLINPKRR